MWYWSVAIPLWQLSIDHFVNVQHTRYGLAKTHLRQPSLPLELILSNRGGLLLPLRILIHKGNTLSPVGINTRDEAHWYMIPPGLLYQKQSIFFYCHIFKFLSVTNFYFYFHFSFSPLKKVCLQTEILGKMFKYIFFCFIFLFTSSSPCRKDQFAVLYFSPFW